MSVSEVIVQVASQVSSPSAALLGYENQLESVKVLLKGLQQGLSTSVVIIGPPGSGKNKLVDTALSTVTHKYVRVNIDGLTHTNDRLAIGDMAKQMHKQVDLDDPKLCYGDCYAHLLSALGEERGVPVVFVLTNVDYLAQQHNQTLLYNLLDASHSGSLPILVLLLSSRLDVLDLLEKRVRSRLSNQVLLTFSSFTFQQYYEYAQRSLTLNNTNSKYWNNSVKECFADAKVRSYFERIFDQDKSVNRLKNYLGVILARIFDGESMIIGEIGNAFDLVTSDYRDVGDKWCVLKGLSLIEMCLLIAIRHILANTNVDAFNFEMVYQEYIKYAQLKLQMLVAPRSSIFNAYDRLCVKEIIVPGDDAENVRRPPCTTFRLHCLQIPLESIINALHGFSPCPFQVKHWANNRITS